MVPGSGFGAPGHIRLSFACSMQTLEKALERMDRVLEADGGGAERMAPLGGHGLIPHGPHGGCAAVALTIAARSSENSPPSMHLTVFPGSSAVERRTVNPLVVGSIPTQGANEINGLSHLSPTRHQLE